jgi:hypothetical protein
VIEICINTDDEMIPGKVYQGLVWGTPEEGEIRIALRCVRTCTLEEYLNFVRENKLSHYVNRTIHDKHLYLVEVLD